MASRSFAPPPLTNIISIVIVQLLLLVVVVVAGRSLQMAESGCYSSIISFGASLSDTGNLFYSLNGNKKKDCLVCNPPYGQDYFHRPTGRFSDGRIFLDFVAETLGLPFVPPYLGGSRGDKFFSKGVNFAVGGATTLNNSFYEEMGFSVDDAMTNLSLPVQMGWFKQVLPSLCSSPSDCSEVLGKSLFVVGEFGGNDYGYPLFAHKSLDETRQIYVPKVIDAISAAIHDLIELGGKTFLVPGLYPLGCNELYLSSLSSESDDYYDSHIGCIKWVNEFAEYHNNKLIEELERLRQRHPDITIIYADCYGVTMKILNSPHNYGFEAPPLFICCGGGGPNNYNKSAECGSKEAKACLDPSSYIYWDQVHFTEATNKLIVQGLFDGSFTTPPLNQTSCPSMTTSK